MRYQIPIHANGHVELIEVLNKRLLAEQEKNIELRNNIVDLIKDREALINQLERLESEKDNSGYRD